MIETRTALARLFVQLAIITIPSSMMHRYSELFLIDDKLKLERIQQKKTRSEI